MTAARALLLAVLLVCPAAAATVGCSREPSTPEARRQRGDEIVRAMSDRLSRAATLTVETTDTRERTRGGQRVTVRTTRQFAIRRPDRIAMQMAGDNDLKGWYDGQKITFVSDAERVWARVAGAPTIDETLDRLAERLAMPMPVADLLYSSPYDALIGGDSTGGYVGRETVGGVATLHVAYQHPGVDWDLWVHETGDPLPKRYRVIDKTLTPPRTTDATFHKWQLDATVPETRFDAVVPAGYERVSVAVQAEESAADTAVRP